MSIPGRQQGRRPCGSRGFGFGTGKDNDRIRRWPFRYVPPMLNTPLRTRPSIGIWTIVDRIPLTSRSPLADCESAHCMQTSVEEEGEPTRLRLSSIQFIGMKLKLIVRWERREVMQIEQQNEKFARKCKRSRQVARFSGQITNQPNHRVMLTSPSQWTSLSSTPPHSNKSEAK